MITVEERTHCPRSVGDVMGPYLSRRLSGIRSTRLDPFVGMRFSTAASQGLLMYSPRSLGFDGERKSLHLHQYSCGRLPQGAWRGKWI